jgi:hypothetical protein
VIAKGTFVPVLGTGIDGEEEGEGEGGEGMDREEGDDGDENEGERREETNQVEEEANEVEEEGNEVEVGTLLQVLRLFILFISSYFYSNTIFILSFLHP